MGEVSTIGPDSEVGLSGARGRCRGRRRDPQACQSRKGAGIFWRVAALPGRDRSLSVSASLGPRASNAGSYGQTDPTELCEDLPQTQQERCESSQVTIRHLFGLEISPATIPRMQPCNTMVSFPRLALRGRSKRRLKSTSGFCIAAIRILTRLMVFRH